MFSLANILYTHTGVYNDCAFNSCPALTGAAKSTMAQVLISAI